jgi:hypothetical protein
MIVEFQHEEADDRWLPLGVARTASKRLDVEEAVAALGTSRGMPLTEGTYRLRALEPTPRWRYAEIDRYGSVRLVDRADTD